MSISPNKSALSKIEQRDNDIHIAAKVRSAIDNDSDDYFILTGSYSIEALTHGEIRHNDIDANIFTTNIHRSLGRTASLMNILELYDGAALTEQTDSRLEYLITNRAIQQKLELQFVEFTDISEKDPSLKFILDNDATRPNEVPTVIKTLEDSSGMEHAFRVKSLPYAIATWALRISGVASSQKRAVRGTDIDHFAFLLSSPHDKADVITSMNHHSQMPSGYAAEEVLSRAMEIKSDSE